VKEKETQFNVYENWMSTRTLKKVDLKYVINQIKNGNGNKENIEVARALGKEHPKYNDIKSKTNIIGWNTTFSNGKTKEDVTGMTGFLYLDKDNLGEEEIMGYKELLMTFPFVVAVWKSFGGKGLGCLAKCDAVTLENFNSVWEAIEKILGSDFDHKVKVASKINVISYDDDIRVNLSASSFDYTPECNKNVSTTNRINKPVYCSSNSNGNTKKELYNTVNTVIINKNYLIGLNEVFLFAYKKSKMVFETQYDQSNYNESGFIIFDEPTPHLKVNSRYFIKEGKRNDSMTAWLSALLILNPKKDRALLFDYFKRQNIKKCLPPLPEKQLKATFNSLYKNLKNGKLYANSQSRYIIFPEGCPLSVSERFSESGRVGSKVKEMRTINIIKKAVEKLKTIGKIIKKNHVVKMAKKCENTIYKHWHLIENDITRHNANINAKIIL